MPIYAIHCPACGEKQDVYRMVKNYDDLPYCCGEKMSRSVTAPFVQTDIQPYKSMVTGEMVTSRSQHRDHLRQHRLLEIGTEVQKPMTELPKQDNTLRKDLTEVLTGYGL